eukprot:Blabericola_migrator_1__5985@NODE_3017_length_2106_cov_21_749387_g1815_i1_p1_GENE_NODE_3017_length_2106_cov_21_749387_g1815_i1NODE_3017_length_2106_cov_21_749387_g1815_i1_p1_ORF_typecomplete_len117_score11_64_NODE_3017_length_2106_cov_21_749387_g1815_i17911141
MLSRCSSSDDDMVNVCEIYVDDIINFQETLLCIQLKDSTIYLERIRRGVEQARHHSPHNGWAQRPKTREPLGSPVRYLVLFHISWFSGSLESKPSERPCYFILYSLDVHVMSARLT